MKIKLILFATFISFMLCAISQPEIKVQVINKSLSSAVFTKDNKYILVNDDGNQLALIDIETGKVIYNYISESVFEGSLCHLIDFSNDGKYITVCVNNNFIIWDIFGVKKYKQFENPSLTQSFAMSPCQKYLLSTAEDSAIRIWDIEKEKIIKTYTNGKKPITATFSPDGYIVCSYYDSTIKYFDINIENEVRTLKDNSLMWGMQFTSDSLYMFACTKNCLTQWDLKSGKKIQEYFSKYKYPSYRLSPDDKYIYLASDTSIIQYDFRERSKKTTFVLEIDDLLRSFAASNDGKMLLTIDYFKGISLWDVSSGKKIKTINNLSEKENYLKIYNKGCNAITVTLNNQVSIWDIKNACLQKRLSFDMNVFTDSTNTSISTQYIDFSNNEKFILIVNYMSKWEKIDGVPEERLASFIDFSVVNIEDNKIIYRNKLIDKFEEASISSMFVKFFENDKLVINADSSIMIINFLTGDTINQFNMLNIGGIPKVINNYAWISVFDFGMKCMDLNNGKVTDSIPGFYWWNDDNNLISDDKKTIIDFLPDSITGKDILMEINSHNEIIKRFEQDAIGFNVAVLSPDGKQILTSSSDYNLRLWDIESGTMKHLFKGHTKNTYSIRFTPDGKNFLSCSSDGTMKYWDAITGQLIYSIMANDKNEYLSWTPEGYFSGSEKLAKEAVYILDSTNVINIDQLFEVYYRPDIVKMKATGIDISKHIKSSIQKGLTLPPAVKMKVNQGENRGISVSDLFMETEVDSVQINIEVTNQGGGIDEIRLFQNGKIIESVGKGKLPLLNKDMPLKMSFIVKLTNGENQIKTLAINSQRTESLPAEIVVSYKKKEIKKPNMYILAVGINSYKNPKYNLNYAMMDAQGFADAMYKTANGIFDSVYTIMVFDTKATRTLVLAEIDKIKLQAQPEDVFVFYYAGHGVMSTGDEANKSDFFLVLHDITKMYEADDQLKIKGISAKDIAGFSKEIKAQKQLFIIDACQSGGAIQAFAMRGAAEEKALAQLARSTGTYFIAASGSEQFATEVASLGHGVFTYSVILSLNGECQSKDGRITVSLIKSCVEDLVPELTKKFKGEAQYPTGYGFGQDFPIGTIKQ